MAHLEVSFFSYTFRRDVDVTIILPTPTFSDGVKPDASHMHKAKFPVLYLLHGAGGSHWSWSRYTCLERYAEEQKIVVVCPSGENKGYRNIEGGERHFDYLAKELPEFMLANFPISDRPEDTYIAGLSMGSGGALWHSLNMPWRFAAVGAFSGSPVSNPNEPVGATQEERMKAMMKWREETKNMPIDELKNYVSPAYAELAKKWKAEGKPFPKFFIASGTKDNPQNSAAFAAFLKDLGCDVHVDVSKEYAHEWPFWEICISEFLAWIPRTDAYVGSKSVV